MEKSMIKETLLNLHNCDHVIEVPHSPLSIQLYQNDEMDFVRLLNQNIEILREMWLHNNRIFAIFSIEEDRTNNPSICLVWRG
jgi:hypothetical protein